MDIYNINVESITKQYEDFINSSKDMNMDIASEYLVMASELIHLKSKLLLHKDDNVEEEDDTSDEQEAAAAWNWAADSYVFYTKFLDISIVKIQSIFSVFYFALMLKHSGIFLKIYFPLIGRDDLHGVFTAHTDCVRT